MGSCGRCGQRFAFDGRGAHQCAEKRRHPALLQAIEDNLPVKPVDVTALLPFAKTGIAAQPEKSGRARLRRIRAGRAPYSCPCGAARNGADKALYRRKQFRKRKCIKQCIQMYNMRYIHSKMHIFEGLNFEKYTNTKPKNPHEIWKFRQLSKKMNKYSRKGLIFPENGV